MLLGFKIFHHEFMILSLIFVCSFGQDEKKEVRTETEIDDLIAGKTNRQENAAK